MSSYITNATNRKVEKAGMVQIKDHLLGENNVLVKVMLHISGYLL